MLALSSLGAAVFRGPLILVMPDLGLHINLDQLESTSNTTFHASGNIGVIFLSSGRERNMGKSHVLYIWNFGMARVHWRQHTYCSKLSKHGRMLSDSVGMARAMARDKYSLHMANIQVQQARTAHAEINTTTILINRNGFATPELKQSRQNEILSLPEC